MMLAMFLPLATVEGCSGTVEVNTWQAATNANQVLQSSSWPIIALFHPITLLTLPIAMAVLTGLALGHTLSPFHRWTSDQWVGLCGSVFTILIIAVYSPRGLSGPSEDLQIGAWVLLAGFVALLAVGTRQRLRERARAAELGTTELAFDPRPAAGAALTCSLLAFLAVPLVLGPLAVIFALRAQAKQTALRRGPHLGMPHIEGITGAAIVLGLMSIMWGVTRPFLEV
jgi:hypothetical protein